MADLKVDYEDLGDNELVIYASPETLRSIADQIEERARVTVKGAAIDLDEPAKFEFTTEWEEA